MTTSTDTPLRWGPLLLDQLDWHWTHQLRPRLDGPHRRRVPLGAGRRLLERAPRGAARPPPVQGGAGDVTIDFAFPEPDPAPVTTIAWRLGHVIVGRASRCATPPTSAAPAADYHVLVATPAPPTPRWPSSTPRWTPGWPACASLGEDGLARPCGRAEGPFADWPLAALVLHIHRELIHHGAELALLRDLYAHRTDAPPGVLMPFHAPPCPTEKDAVAGFLVQQQDAFRAAIFGLTDDAGRPPYDAQRADRRGPRQARHRRPARLAGLGPRGTLPRPVEDRTQEQQMADWQAEFTWLPEDTVAGALAAFDEVSAQVLRAVADTDLETAVPVPGRALEPPRRGVLERPLGVVPPDRGAGPARRPRRHHPRGARRRDDVRAGRRPRGHAGHAVADALAAGERLMPYPAPPVADEREGYAAYLAQHQLYLRAAVTGLPDDRAGERPVASELSLGTLVKHVTLVAGQLAGGGPRRAGARLALVRRRRPRALASGAHLGRRRHAGGCARGVRQLERRRTPAARAADPDTPVPVHRAPWTPRDVPSWSVRWVWLHLVTELARHAGHADIIREQLDGRLSFELLASWEGDRA